MKHTTTRLDTNVYFIPERLREMDEGYFVVRNHQTKTFEIHHAKQPHSTYCLTVPYSELDARTLELVKKTSISRMEHLLREMDSANEKLAARKSQLPCEATEKTKEVLNYLNRHESLEWVDDKAFSTRFI